MCRSIYIIINVWSPDGLLTWFVCLSVSPSIHVLRFGHVKIILRKEQLASLINMIPPTCLTLFMFSFAKRGIHCNIAHRSDSVYFHLRQWV